jgi:hypothetical protein
MTSAHNAPVPTHFVFSLIAFPGGRSGGQTGGLYLVGGVTNERPQRGTTLLFLSDFQLLSSLLDAHADSCTRNENKATEQGDNSGCV